MRIYGAWAGDPKGTEEDITRCIVEVWPQSGRWTSYQCNRKRGYGPDKLFCKQHTKKVVKRRKKEKKEMGER